MTITDKELQNIKAPFTVKWVGKRGKPVGKPFVVSGFSENDPLSVGGGMFPNFATAHFKGGGWTLVADLQRCYALITKDQANG
jgi:hypothetical protein